MARRPDTRDQLIAKIIRHIAGGAPILTPYSSWPAEQFSRHWYWIGPRTPREGTYRKQGGYLARHNPRPQDPALVRLGDTRFRSVQNAVFALVRPDEWSDDIELRKVEGMCLDTMCVHPFHWDTYPRRVPCEKEPLIEIPAYVPDNNAEILWVIEEEMGDLRSIDLQELVSRLAPDISEAEIRAAIAGTELETRVKP